MEIENPAHKIYLNKKLWLDIKPDKLVFGGDFLKNGQHLTIPFGLKSGFMDLHLTQNGNHYPICYMSLITLFQVFSSHWSKLILSVFQGLTELTPEFFKEEQFEIQIVKGLDKVTDNKFDEAISVGITNLKSTPDSKKLKIDQESDKFQNFTKELGSKQQIKTITPEELFNLDEFTAIASNDRSTYLLTKGQLTGFKPCVFNSFNLDIHQVLTDVFGGQIMTLVESRMEEGDKILNSENVKERLSEVQEIELKLKSDI
ncbi:hypothetical protein [Marinoscillum sp.]|uniref:hypothetical protein n=1 Tax=Marinoscillum sp. TaxID=2024838 RepID=UPI003BACD184